MIRSYTDHAANERTYLAWVRTALAFMGFGLLVERFDLFARALPGVPDARLPAEVSSNVIEVLLLSPRISRIPLGARTSMPATALPTPSSPRFTVP